MNESEHLRQMKETLGAALAKVLAAHKAALANTNRAHITVLDALLANKVAFDALTKR